MELDDERDEAGVDPAPGPRYLSPSSADTYNQCARRWKFRYVDGLPDPPGVAALAGTFAHRVLESLMQLDPAERTLDRARSLARECWPETEGHADFLALGLGDDERRAFRWRGWSAIEGLWTLEDPQKVVVEATEHQVLTTVAGVPFRGIVDRLDRDRGSLVVSDYKSGRAPSPRFADKRLTQVMLYAAAVESTFGERPERVRLLYLGQKTIERAVDSDAIDRIGEGLNDTWNRLGADMATGSYEPTPGPLCGWCPYAAMCPEGLAEVQRRNDQGLLDPAAPAATLVA